MKNLLFCCFVFFTSLVFSQTACTCGDPKVNGCEANCAAGFVAICQGFDGSCQCSCERIVLTPVPKDPVPITFRSYKVEEKKCELINPRLLGQRLKYQLIPIDSIYYISRLDNFIDINKFQSN